MLTARGARANAWLAALTAAGMLAGGSLWVTPARAEDAKPLYSNNFSQVEVGKVPADFLVLAGEFAVREEGGSRFLELPGAPLDSYGALFGPNVKTDVAVTARIFSTKKGRRFPTFGVGLNGQSGYRMQVSPGKGELELFHGDELVAHVPFEWKSGEWTQLRLQVLRIGDVWQVTGKAWAKGATEPTEPSIAFEDKKEPAPGRASILGSPYATTPIQFADLAVTSVAGPAAPNTPVPTK